MITRRTMSSASWVRTICPSTRIRSSGSTRSPSVATLPLTDTRPAAIQVSSSRREPSPVRARTFCSFSLIVVFGSSGGGFSVRFNGLLWRRRLLAILAVEFRQQRIHLVHVHQVGLVDIRLLLHHVGEAGLHRQLFAVLYGVLARDFRVDTVV